MRLIAISIQEEMTMDWNRVEGNWKQFKGSAKEKWGKLTDDDLDVIERAAASNSKASCSSATALPRTRSARTWTTGSAP